MIYGRKNRSFVLRVRLKLCAMVPGAYGVVLMRRVPYSTRSELQRVTVNGNTRINIDGARFFLNSVNFLRFLLISFGCGLV